MRKLSPKHFDEPVIFDPEEYEIVYSPPCKEKGCWAGAPSVFKDEKGSFWMAHRNRKPEVRGFEVVVSRSSDGKKFEPVNKIKKGELGVQSLERPALFRDPFSGKFELYLSADPSYYGWHLVKLKNSDLPLEFEVEDREIVFKPDPTSRDEVSVKDPYMISVGRKRFMFYIGWDQDGESPYMATSVDGLSWERSESNPLLERSGWHSGLTRISCVMPLDKGYMAYYEGTDREKFFDLKTGLAYSTNLKSFTDLTPDEPILESPVEGSLSTLRYLDYVVEDERILFYYEAARKEGALELRVSEVKKE